MPDVKGVGEPLAVVPHERFVGGALVTGHGEDIEALPTEKSRNRLGPPTSLCPVLYSTEPSLRGYQTCEQTARCRREGIQGKARSA